MLWRPLTTALAICSLPLTLVACAEKSQTDPRIDAPLVRVAIVQSATSRSRTFTGIVAARVQSDLGFRVSGKVLERLVNTGQSVKRGQLLMRIDPVDLALAAHAQQEAVTAAQAWAQQTLAEEARSRSLRGSGAISVSSYEQAKAAADAAAAQLKAAEAQADVARNRSRYTELVADADGVIVETLAEPGQVVNTAQVVVRLAHAGPREAVIQLPETLRPAVGSIGEATLFGKTGASVPAKLRQLADAADPLTRTFEARYVLDGELAGAPLGTTVTVQVTDALSRASGDLQVPLGALLDVGKGPGLWIIESTKVSWRAVAVQSLDDDSACITGQLKQGDRIVALGAHLLREGEQVRVADQVASATAGARP